MDFNIIIAALILTLLAGVLNGSFAAPTKYMTDWKEENIWFFFSFWGFLILPWLTILLLNPEHMNFIAYVPGKVLILAVIGGIIWGIGQLTCSLAFGLIGLGLTQIINISMGTAGAALIPLLWYKGLLFSKYGLIQGIGILIFVVAVTIGVRAGADRDKNKKSNDHQEQEENKNVSSGIKAGKAALGVLFALVAGIGSIFQGVSYAYANPIISDVTLKLGMNSLAASLATWVIVFSSAWIPYCIYFLILCFKRKTFKIIFKSASTKEYLYLFVVMAFGYWGSVVFFSRASSLIGGNLAPTIAWPLFMIFIILTSNFWGWISGEWKNAGSKAIGKIWTSIAFFIVAILVFSSSAMLQP